MSRFGRGSTRFDPNPNDDRTKTPLPSFFHWWVKKRAGLMDVKLIFRALMMFTIWRPTVTQTLPLLSGVSKTL